MKSPSYSYWHFMSMEMKFKGETAHGCWETIASSSWHRIQGMSLSLCPFREEVGKSHIFPSGSGRRNCEFHLVLSVPLPRPCLSSSLTCWQHGPVGNQRQMCTRAVHRSSSRYRKDDLASGTQQWMMSSRWCFPSHQTRTNQESCVCPVNNDVNVKNMVANKSDWASCIARPFQKLDCV